LAKRNGRKGSFKERKIASDPQVQARNLIRTIKDQQGNQYQMVATPVRFPSLQETDSKPAPGKGQDTIPILKELGYSEREINEPSIIRALILGGAGEIGMNCLLLQEGKRLIMIDCGVGFPSQFLPGVDVIIPDFQWIEQRASRLQGVILTHGHEDHIGALPYFLKRVDVPVYGTQQTGNYPS